MFFFNLSLHHNIHCDSVEAALQVFNSPLKSFNCVHCSFLFDLIFLLLNQECHFLCFSIKFSPAQLNVTVATIAERDLVVSYVLDCVKLVAILPCCEADHIFVHSCHRIRNRNAVIDRLGLNRDTHWLHSAKCEL